MDVTEILCQLIAIPSVNPMGRPLVGDIYLESRISDWLEHFFQSIQASYERIEVAPGRANVIARYQASTSKRTILFDVHQDTVPIDGMTIDPFKPERHAGRITGRGAADVKGGMAAMLFAFRRLMMEKPSSAPNVVLSCTCDEEATILGVRDLVTYWQNRKGISKLLETRPDCAIVAEPTELHAVVAHRGVVRFRVHARGRACHSSDPTQGKNAIYSMAKIVERLARTADELARDIPPHPLCGPATLSVGRIEGGISVNTVPAHCVIEVDRRIIPGESPERAWEHLRNVVHEADGTADCEAPWTQCPALDNSHNQVLASRLLYHVAQVGLPKSQMGVPYGTHASTISQAGVPSVVFGPGSIAQAHTQDEYIEIESLENAAEVYFRFCCGEWD